MIQFENIKTGEKVTFDGTQDPSVRQAHLAAYLNSSNLSPNALKGQDFGWRLAPEVVGRIDAIKTDPQSLDNLARRIGAGVDDIQDFHILNYVAEQDFAAEAMAEKNRADATLHQEDYEKRLREIREKSKASEEKTDNAKIEEPTPTKPKEKK